MLPLFDYVSTARPCFILLLLWHMKQSICITLTRQFPLLSHCFSLAECITDTLASMSMMVAIWTAALYFKIQSARLYGSCAFKAVLISCKISSEKESELQERHKLLTIAHQKIFASLLVICFLFSKKHQKLSRTLLFLPVRHPCQKHTLLWALAIDSGSNAHSTCHSGAALRQGRGPWGCIPAAQSVLDDCGWKALRHGWWRRRYRGAKCVTIWGIMPRVSTSTVFFGKTCCNSFGFLNQVFDRRIQDANLVVPFLIFKDA